MKIESKTRQLFLSDTGVKDLYIRVRQKLKYKNWKGRNKTASHRKYSYIPIKLKEF